MTTRRGSASVASVSNHLWNEFLKSSCNGLEFFARFALVNVPSFLLAKSPELDRISSITFAYLTLQVVGFAWAVLANASFALACKTTALLPPFLHPKAGGSASGDFSSQSPLSSPYATLQVVAAFYVFYASIRVVISFAQSVFHLAMESIKDFPDASQVLSKGGVFTLKLGPIIFIPALALELCLIFADPLCSQFDTIDDFGSTSPIRYESITHGVCYHTGLYYLTSAYGDIRRLVFYSLLTMVIQMWQILLHEFPRWDLAFKKLSLAVRFFFQFSILVLTIMTLIITGVVFFLMQFNTISSEASLLCILLFGWTMWLYLFLPFLIATHGEAWAKKTTQQSIQHLAGYARMSHMCILSCMFFGDLAFYGLLQAQLDLTFTTIAVPALYCCVYTMASTSIEAGPLLLSRTAPLAFLLSFLITVVIAQTGGKGGVILVFCHIFGKLIHFFGDDDDDRQGNTDGRDDSGKWIEEEEEEENVASSTDRGIVLSSGGGGEQHQQQQQEEVDELKMHEIITSMEDSLDLDALGYTLDELLVPMEEEEDGFRATEAETEASNRSRSNTGVFATARELTSPKKSQGQIVEGTTTMPPAEEQINFVSLQPIVVGTTTNAAEANKKVSRKIQPHNSRRKGLNGSSSNNLRNRSVDIDESMRSVLVQMDLPTSTSTSNNKRGSGDGSTAATGTAIHRSLSHGEGSLNYNRNNAPENTTNETYKDPLGSARKVMKRNSVSGSVLTSNNNGTTPSASSSLNGRGVRSERASSHRSADASIAANNTTGFGGGASRTSLAGQGIGSGLGLFLATNKSSDALLLLAGRGKEYSSLVSLGLPESVYKHWLVKASQRNVTFLVNVWRALAVPQSAISGILRLFTAVLVFFALLLSILGLLSYAQQSFQIFPRLIDYSLLEDGTLHLDHKIANVTLFPTTPRRVVPKSSYQRSCSSSEKYSSSANSGDTMNMTSPSSPASSYWLWKSSAAATAQDGRHQTCELNAGDRGTNELKDLRARIKRTSPEAEKHLIEPHYGICGWQMHGLTLLDFALLSEAAYYDEGNGVNLQDLVSAMLPDLDFVVNVTHSRESMGIGSGPMYVELTSESLGVTVLAIRGTDVARPYDLMEDIKMFAEPVIFTLLSGIFPTIRLWSQETTSKVIEWLYEFNSFFGLQGEAEYYRPLTQRIYEIIHSNGDDSADSVDGDSNTGTTSEKDDGKGGGGGGEGKEGGGAKKKKRKEVVMTGHSLGGGLARIAGTLTGQPSVSFSPPGLALSYRKYSAASADGSGTVVKIPHKGAMHHNSVAVITEFDFIPQVDHQVGLIQTILCDKVNLAHQNSCHLLEGTICHLLQHCGDEKERFSGCHYEFDFTAVAPSVITFIWSHRWIFMPVYLLITLTVALAVVPELL